MSVNGARVRVRFFHQTHKKEGRVHPTQQATNISDEKRSERKTAAHTVTRGQRSMFRVSARLHSKPTGAAGAFPTKLSYQMKENSSGEKGSARSDMLTRQQQNRGVGCVRACKASPQERLVKSH